MEEVSTPKPFLWKQIFIDHKKWVGEYEYREQGYHFQFNVQSVQLDYKGAILGMFAEDHGSKFDVKGRIYSIDKYCTLIAWTRYTCGTYPD